ncbi:MAG TPA: universal stress protein [Ilumatobacteraceae bacterium]|nr:universal stress protein [Ilumatobacteraceae bacterium]
MSTTPGSMTVLLCTDGSDLALSAIRQGLDLLATPDRIVVLTVVSPVDPSLVTGTGFAGGVMSFEEKNDLVEAQREAAEVTLAETVAALGLSGVETLLQTGDAGHTICEVAEELPASVVVLGTHGRSGIRRAVMGSTSDYVVRHAVCPVLVQQQPG